ncbi:hypothetical protein ACWEFL_17260 [Streptomyces sp. NPDC004838]
MSDRIARALTHALLRVLDLVFPPRGRHRAAPVTSRPRPVVICAPRTLIPVHVLARTAPAPRPPRIPPYLRNWITAQEADWEPQRKRRQQQRRLAAVAATLGYDVPFPFDASDVTRVGVSA